MPSLKGVVVHDGYANLVWASEDWDLGDEVDLVKETIANRPSRIPQEFTGRRAHRRRGPRSCIRSPLRSEQVELLGVVVNLPLQRLAGAQHRGAAAQPTVRQILQSALGVSAPRAFCCARSSGHASAISEVRERDLSLAPARDFLESDPRDGRCR